MFRTRAVLIPVFAAVLACTGCFEARYVLHVMPDNSGKMIVDAIYGKDVQDVLNAQAPGDSAETFVDGLSADDIATAKEWGIAAIVDDKSVSSNTGFRGTVYFDDINRLKLCAGDDPECVNPGISFRLTRDGEIVRLEIIDASLEGLAATVAEGVTDDEEAEATYALLSQMSMSLAVTAPGRVTSAEGFDRIDGRVATVAVDKARIDAARKAADPTRVPTRLVVMWSGESIPDADVVAFRKEIADARARFVPVK